MKVRCAIVGGLLLALAGCCGDDETTLATCRLDAARQHIKDSWDKMQYVEDCMKVAGFTFNRDGKHSVDLASSYDYEVSIYTFFKMVFG